jgi:hypothetical protein
VADDAIRAVKTDYVTARRIRKSIVG